jgi:hypothetical protein
MDQGYLERIRGAVEEFLSSEGATTLVSSY